MTVEDQLLMKTLQVEKAWTANWLLSFQRGST